jgi:hypothetical protein
MSSEATTAAARTGPLRNGDLSTDPRVAEGLGVLRVARTLRVPHTEHGRYKAE